ncbi:MAG: hypothetical protein HGA45_19840 [Chloroflexales bacterium]|nr:hypothetical protein [Chloroflexales bacterium]
MAGRRQGAALLRLALAVAVGALLLAALPARAQSDVRYFTETGHSLRGAFRAFWEANGALDIFGYPITEEFTAAGGRLVQWFERARFEYTEVSGRPVVELGNVGVEITQGKLFPKSPPIQDTADLRYIPQTQHVIKFGFKTTWETRGAERIFGYPISDEIQEVLDDGAWHTVQYFEKARFEFWPAFAPGKRVLISHLGRRLAPPEQMAPVPPPVPGQQPGPAQPPPSPPAPVPPGVNGKVTPESGPPGTVFTFEASGFESGERVGVWLTAPDQSTYGVTQQTTADSQGSITGARISITSDTSFPEGLYSFNAQGVRSKREARGFFRLTTLATPGDPNKLGQIVHDQLPRQGQSFIVPVAAPPGYTFIMLGAGFQSDEPVSAWVTGPDGKSTAIASDLVEAANGSAQARVNTGGLPEGAYTAVIQGQRSKVTAAAGFKLTRDFVAGPGTVRPASVNGSASPAEATLGTVLQVRGQGLRPGERLDYWITDPSGAYVLLPDSPAAEGDGRIGYNPALDLKVTEEALAGVYGIHFRGRQSGARVDVYFTVKR